MWFRRRRRQPPPVLLPSLDRLAELIERVVALLDQVALAPARAPAPVPELAPAQPEVEQPAALPPAPTGHILFVSAPDGYRLLERDGPPPERGTVLELDNGAFFVLRLGPSPHPGDRRRCAFVEREEPPSAERTLDR